MANHIFIIGLAVGLLVGFGAAAQQKPANDASKPAAKEQASDTAKQRDTVRERNDISRDPDRSAIGPRTTQGLAQDAISRSNSR